MLDKDAEKIQKIIVRYVATHPAGLQLALIGGFRYRFLNNSVRVSNDIDYHWVGDLQEKQKKLIHSFERDLLLEVSRHLGYSGSVSAKTGSDADSQAVRVINLSFWKENVPYSRIEIPVDITRIACADAIIVRTVDGTVYPTVSEADMVESKVIAVFNRRALEYRDILDVFLFQSQFALDSGQRLKQKLKHLGINNKVIENKIHNLKNHPAYHARAIQQVIESQLDSNAAKQLNHAGGGTMVLDTFMSTLKSLFQAGENQ
jgi:predicted nucleotidyltransferase component of viral defense system